MIESIVGLLLIGLFCLVGWAIQASPEALVRGGIGLAALGFAYGIPTAIVYHWRLYQSLSRAERLPARWWISPTSHHELLPAPDRSGVLLWGAIGGSGFGVIVVGILLTSIGLWRLLGA